LIRSIWATSKYHDKDLQRWRSFFCSAAFYLKKSTKEIAVVGSSNSLFSTIKPNLSGIDQPGNRIGETAVKYLIDEINNETKSIIKNS
jgi:DNA-binding LacI/PurR family transcriptional regulator